MDCSISAYGPSYVERFFPQKLRFLRFHSSFEAVSCDVICQLSHDSWVGSRSLRWASGCWGNQCHHNSSSELPLKDPKIPLLPTEKWFPRSSWRMLRLLTTNSQLPFKTYALNRVSFATFGCDMMWQRSMAKAALKGVELMTAQDIKHMILLPGLLQTPVSLWHYEWLAALLSASQLTKEASVSMRHPPIVAGIDRSDNPACWNWKHLPNALITWSEVW